MDEINTPIIMPDEELHIAAADGNLELIETLLSDGVDCDTRNEFGWTPLMQAVNFGHPAVIATLISRGADVNARNDFGTAQMIF
jgi:ankyrin repeat protein